MADIRTNDAPAAALAAPPPAAQPAAAHADPAAATAQHDRLAERLDGQPAPPPAVSPPLAAAPAGTTRQPPPSTTSDAARVVRFRPGATNEWDRMPAEIQNKILKHAGVLTLWLNGRIEDIKKISLTHFKELLRDVFETDWRGDLAELPFEKFKQSPLCEPFWRMRTRSMHARVKALKFNFLSDSLDQAAILNGWADLLHPNSYTKLSHSAARCGSVEMLQRLVDERKIVAFDKEHVRFAAAFGHLHLLEWLHKRMPSRIWTAKVMDYAAGNGHLDCVKWLHANRTEGCTADAMDGAAKNGHIAVVKWLHANRTEGCTTDAMDWAAESGHLAVLEFLHNNHIEGCTSRAMDAAAAEGHLDCVKFLHNNRTEGCTNLAMDQAAKNGHLSVVEWLHNNRLEGCTVWAMNYAAENGHLAVVKWLHANRTEGCSLHAWEYSAQNGHADIIEFLYTNRANGSIVDAAGSAVRSGQLSVLRRIHELVPDVVMGSVVNDAASGGHTLALDWIFDNTNARPTERSISCAADRGKLYMLRWFHERMPEMLRSYMASRLGAYAESVIEWFIRDDLPHDSADVMRLAIQEDHVEIIDWLLMHLDENECYDGDLELARELVDSI
ncbi:hypothetical protein HK105_208248 [Polyrhizophydium stewartii]|uniref:Ankyrin repeat protein n=1 Tax=Polyrhizophydium stewartii TaxID=2732419 RepID=A0ABR4MYB4_9FUNG